MQRRSFLKAAALSGVAALAAQVPLSQNSSAEEKTPPKPPEELHVAVNQFTANNIYSRDNKNFLDHLKELRDVGVDGLEATIDPRQGVSEDFVQKLKDAGLKMRSVYITLDLCSLGEVENACSGLEKVLERCKDLETKIVVINPAAKHGKSDEELEAQCTSIQRMKRMLGDKAEFAFHYHTTELEFGGREFHHLLCGTKPEEFSLCLEQHWSYRASGNSQLALFDHLKLYADRVNMVHFRQSKDNIWTETFGDGDIDNVKLAAKLKELKKPLHFVLEQAAENGTPHTLSAPEVFKQSVQYVRRVFS